MIYTTLTNKAMKIAYNAHHGQTDKSGLPYIFHPYHLAEQMTDETSTCVALLHDVVEDTPLSLDDLAQEFPPAVIDALRLLTHTPDVDYFDYVRAICQNPVARQVKLADLAHNSDETRFIDCSTISADALTRRREKYAKARAILANCPS